MTGDTDRANLLVYLNGEYVRWADAKIHIFSPAVKYGATVFEGIRSYWSDAQNGMNLFRSRDHLLRMELSQKIMRFERIFTADELAEPVAELVRRNGFETSVHIRPTAYVDGEGEAAATGPIGVFISAIEWPTPSLVWEGCTAQVSSWQRLTDQSMPVRVKASANYNNSRFAAMQAKADGYDTAILLNQNGHVSEGSSMCLFILRDGIPVTPSITSDILESITRATAIDLLRDALGLETRERDAQRSELYAAKEAFFCGTGWEITPVTSIDGIAIGDGQVGAVTKRLQSAYFDLVTGVSPDRKGWLTKI